MLAFVHSTVGLQHAAMGLYNAYCDRAPVFVIVMAITWMKLCLERPGTGDWVHAVQDPAGLVRDFTKFDDQPVSLQSFGESAGTRWPYKIAMTPPMGPVLLVGGPHTIGTADARWREADGSGNTDRQRLRKAILGRLKAAAKLLRRRGESRHRR